MTFCIFRALSHPISAITGSSRITPLTTPMNGRPIAISPSQLAPFKIGNNLQIFSSIPKKYTSNPSLHSGGKRRRGKVGRSMSVRSRSSDSRVKPQANRYCMRLYHILYLLDWYIKIFHEGRAPTISHLIFVYKNFMQVPKAAKCWCEYVSTKFY